MVQAIAEQNPLQFKFPFALWTPAMVQTFIAEQFSVRLSHSSVCRLLIQLGLTAQRPLWRAYRTEPRRGETLVGEGVSRNPAESRNAKGHTYSLLTRPAYSPTTIVAPPETDAVGRRWCQALGRGSVSI